MPVTFELNNNDGYFISTWTGAITNAEMLTAYKDFFEGEEWSPALNELANTSQADLFNITSLGLRQLALYMQQVHKTNGLASVRTSAYCPQDLPFKLAIIYESWIKESPESIKVFSDVHEAESWLMRKN
jgi:hypothetical protein